MLKEDLQSSDLVRQVGRKPYQIVAPDWRTVHEHFAQLVPTRPYCADNPQDGLQILRRDQALQRRHIQLNGPHDIRWLNFDVDRPDARFAAEDANLVQPTFIAINPSNGHAHLAYLLGQPVLRFAKSRMGPLRFAAAVERGYVRRLGADPLYAGLIAKNPIHPHWRAEWLAPGPYDLGTLADWLFECDMRLDPGPKVQSGFGRNCQLFDDLRAVAYREVLTFKRQGASYAEFATRLKQLAFAINQQFPGPLGTSEVRSIIRSVANWTWRRFSPERFAEIQASRGRQLRTTTKNRMALIDGSVDRGA